MKKILFLLLLTASVYSQNPSRFTKIQITGNSNSGTATKVNVQESNGEVNTQSIGTAFNKNFGLNSGDVVGASTILNQYSNTPTDWTAQSYTSGQVVFYGGKQWIATSATLASDIPASSLKWKETTFEAINNSLSGKLSGSNYPDYVAQNAPTSITSTTYQSFPLMLRSNFGKVLLFYRDGADHAASKGVVKMRVSEDGGGNFGGETTIVTDAVYDCRNVSGGVTPTGRIVLFYMRYNFTASTSFDQGFIYSDDDGSTWSNYQTIPSGTHTFFSPYGEMIAVGNNKLMACWYGETPAAPTYSTYVITSSDNGLTWSSAVAVATSTSLRYGEASYAYLDGGVIVGHVRNSTGSPLYQVISTNNGATWTNQGVTTVDTAAQVSPMLATFIDPNNQKYVASFYANRGDNKLKVAIAEYATAVAGVSGWTRTDIDSHTSTDFGYPTFIKSKENNKFLIAYYKAASTTLASIYFKNYTPNYGNIAVTGTISSTGNISSNSDISATNNITGKDIKASQTLQIKGNIASFPTTGAGLEMFNQTGLSIIQSYDRTGTVFQDLNIRGLSLKFFYGNALEGFRLTSAGRFLLGQPTDNLTDIAQFNGTAISQGWKTSGGASTDYVTGTGSLINFNSGVRTAPLTGYTSGAGVISASDTVLQAIQKLNGNDALKAPLASPTFTGTVTVPNGVNPTDAVNVSQLNAAGTSGSYTPTLTASSNITGLTFNSAFYTKVGNVVTARITVTFSTTSGSTFSSFTFTLPVNKATSTSISLGNGNSITGSSVSNSVDVVSTASINTATASFISGAGSGANGKATIFIMYDITQ